MALVVDRRRWMALVVAVVCSLGLIVDGTLEDANNYRNMINNIRSLLSHVFRDNTGIATGGRMAVYVPMNFLTDVETSVDLILSHRNLYLEGYRVVQDGQRVVYHFQDANVNGLDPADFDRREALAFGGSYRELTSQVGQSREEVQISTFSLRDGIQVLLQPPNRNNQEARARMLLSLVMIVSEAARFRDIENSVYNALRNGDTWRASTWDTGLMNSWDDMSRFVITSTRDPTGPTSQFFSNLNADLTVTAILSLCAVLLRCNGAPRNRRQAEGLQCAPTPALDAALVDGPNNVYFFNGPNMAYIRFTPGSTDDTIVDGVKSIYNEWPFLRGTPFIGGLDCAFRVPGSTNGYIFAGPNYALIDVPGKRIINGPNRIWDSWSSLRPTSFVNGLDACFHSIRENEVYMFRGDQYVLVNYAPGTTNDWTINGPNSIYDSWPSLRSTFFESGMHAAFSRTDNIEAYLFKWDMYVLIDYAPGTTNDRIVNGPLKIRDGWPSLRNTAFDS